MYGLRLHARGFGEPLRRPSRGAAGNWRPGRAVGARCRHFTPFARRIRRIEFTNVVLPTPGPPEITTIRFPRTVFSASRWLGASLLRVRTSHHATALSKSIGGEAAPLPPTPAILT